MKKQEILRKIKLFLFDMDGTLYIGDRLFDFTPRLLDTIKRNGGRYMFLTNNSSKSVNDYIKKLGGMGIKADYDEYYATADAVFALSFYLPLADDPAPQESTTVVNNEATTSTTESTTAQQNKDAEKTSPKTGVQTVPAICAAACALTLGAVAVKKKNK